MVVAVGSRMGIRVSGGFRGGPDSTGSGPYNDLINRPTIAVKRRQTVKALVAGLVLAGSLCAAQAADILPKAGKPEEVGLSSERLARLAKVTQDHIDAGRLPGAVILIARRGRIAYYEAF